MILFACTFPTKRDNGQDGLRGSLQPAAGLVGGDVPELLVLVSLHVGVEGSRHRELDIRAPVARGQFPALLDDDIAAGQGDGVGRAREAGVSAGFPHGSRLFTVKRTAHDLTVATCNPVLLRNRMYPGCCPEINVKTMHELAIVNLGNHPRDRLGDDGSPRHDQVLVVAFHRFLNRVLLVADRIQQGNERIHLLFQLRMDDELVGLTCMLPEAQVTVLRENPHLNPLFLLLEQASACSFLDPTLCLKSRYSATRYHGYDLFPVSSYQSGAVMPLAFSWLTRFR